MCGRAKNALKDSGDCGQRQDGGDTRSRLHRGRLVCRTEPVSKTFARTPPKVRMSIKQWPQKLAFVEQRVAQSTVENS